MHDIRALRADPAAFDAAMLRRGLPAVAEHWDMPVGEAFPILRDNFCGNADAAAWILRSALADAHGDFWEGVGRYHSTRSDLQAAYLRRVLAAARRLRSGQHDG